MKKVPQGLMKDIENLAEIEKIIWAYSGAKKCSDFEMETNNKMATLSAFDKLALNFDGEFLKVNGWPSWEAFADKYHSATECLCDLPTGLFYDIPYCCSKNYQRMNIESYNNFYSAHPFRGQNTLKGVLDSEPESPLELSVFFKDLKKHEEFYYFKQNHDMLHPLFEKVKRLGLLGRLPDSVFLLLGQTYVPCRPRCRKFLSQSANMLKSLKINLGNQQADRILHHYLEQAVESR